jgi:hypothetical protein
LGQEIVVAIFKCIIKRWQTLCRYVNVFRYNEMPSKLYLHKICHRLMIHFKITIVQISWPKVASKVKIVEILPFQIKSKISQKGKVSNTDQYLS